MEAPYKAGLMRVAIVGFQHESNTFSQVPTQLQQFREGNFQRGEALIPVWKDAHHEVGGFLAGCAEHGLEAVPILMAETTPGGPLTKECYEAILAEIEQGLQAAGKLDGLLLALHGAMVSETFDSADGETCRRLRALIGPDLPFVLNLDHHGNISAPMIEAPDAIVAYRSYPHIDQRDRGRECAAIIASMLRGEIKPRAAYAKPPMLLHIVQQFTGSGPMREIMDEARRIAAQPGIVTASFMPGFIYADVPLIGPTAIVVADDDPQRAQAEADHLARFAWDRRARLNVQLPSPAEAAREVVAAQDRPICLMDCGDNIGGGGPGDSTILFAELIAQGARNLAVVLHDPVNADACSRAGVGAEVNLSVGGKTLGHGAPVAIRGVVLRIDAGKFTEPEPRHGGKRFFDQGLTAVVETDQGHLVVLNSLREVPMSLHQLLSLEIDPATRTAIIVKGATAPRAAYEPVCSRVIAVDTPGITAPGPDQFVYKRRPRPLYPLETDGFTGW
jgi:microcystin degradation protein MlrC